MRIARFGKGDGVAYGVVEGESGQPQTIAELYGHPFGIDPNYDYSKEPTTLVEFTLEPKDGGTQLTIVESGFDAIPIERRSDAFEANDEGWEAQAKMIAKYLALPA